MSNPNQKPSIAATRVVNPSSEETKITVEQLWKALELKVRQPQLFLPHFQSCDVVSDDGNKVVRKAHSKTGLIVEETCYIYAPTMVYFDGDIRVTNIISYSESGELLLTYSFVNGVPGLTTKAHYDGDTPETAIKMAGGAVEHTLGKVREMVREGKL